MNCPFYSFTMYRTEIPGKAPFLLIPNPGSNQCAVVHDRHAPCFMEIHHLEIDWRECPLIKEIRMGV